MKNYLRMNQRKQNVRYIDDARSDLEEINKLKDSLQSGFAPLNSNRKM